MASPTVLPVQYSRVCRNTIVPNDNSSRGPLDSSLEVLCLCNVVVKESQHKLAFFLLEADYSPRNCLGLAFLRNLRAARSQTLGIDEERFLAGNLEQSVLSPDNVQ
jgi:hypothetical protein